jgi:hypothetical protein
MRGGRHHARKLFNSQQKIFQNFRECTSVRLVAALAGRLFALRKTAAGVPGFSFKVRTMARSEVSHGKLQKTCPTDSAI